MNILIIRFSSLGDVVMASAAADALHRTVPDASLSLLTKDIYRPLFVDDERIERVIGIQGDEIPTKIVRMLGGVSYDMVIDLHGSLRSRLVTALVRAPVKRRVKKHVLERRLMIWSRNRFRRSFDVLGNYLETLKPLGVTERILPRLVTSAKARTHADHMLISIGSNPVGIAPGSKHPSKRWNERSFARAADEIARRGSVPLFIGDDNDVPVVERIQELMEEKSVSTAGKCDISDTVGIISRLAGIITNDSGPMHIAGALGVPFVAIFGPTHPDLGFVPDYPHGRVIHSGIPCSPCSLHGQVPCRRERRFCMDDITSETVIDVLYKIMN